MIEEPLNMDSIQRRIAEYQKRIRHNYSILQNDELEDYQSSRILRETDELKELVYSLQNRLKELYRSVFSGSQTGKFRTVYND